jgi:hypothetical protein
LRATLKKNSGLVCQPQCTAPPHRLTAPTAPTVSPHPPHLPSHRTHRTHRLTAPTASPPHRSPRLTASPPYRTHRLTAPTASPPHRTHRPTVSPHASNPTICHTPLTLSLLLPPKYKRGGREGGGACPIIHSSTRALPLLYPPSIWYYSTLGGRRERERRGVTLLFV